jgi:DNA-binding GntR family transcriptional regulator
MPERRNLSMSAMKKFKTTTLADEVASYLRREFILSDSYPPGTFIREEELAQKLNISRAPVREGLKILEGRGLLRAIPQKGSIVVGFSPDEIEELYDIRFALEDIVFREIIRRGTFTPKDYEYLKKLLGKMLLLGKSGDTRAEILLEFSSIDLEFHLHLAECSGRKITLQMLRTVYHQIQQAIVRDVATEKDIEHLVAEHLKILEALEAGDLKSLQMNRFYSYFHRRITALSPEMTLNKKEGAAGDRRENTPDKTVKPETSKNPPHN